MASRPAALLDRSFYFVLSLIIAAIVVAGFSQTIDAGLIHPPSPIPLIVYFHAAVFMGWVLLFIVQTALIRTRNVKLHRKVGVLGFSLGITLAILGVATAIVMARFRSQHGSTQATSFLVVPLYDMVQFTILFGLAIGWRKTPEFHRRLMFLATCGLTTAAFGRLIPDAAPIALIYVGVDALILLGLGRDWVAARRIHPVYLYALPAIVAGQATTMYLFLSNAPIWLSMARSLIGYGLRRLGARLPLARRRYRKGARTDEAVSQTHGAASFHPVLGRASTRTPSGMRNDIEPATIGPSAIQTKATTEPEPSFALSR